MSKKLSNQELKTDMNSNVLSPIHEDYPYGNIIGRWKRDGETYININYSDNGHAEYKTLTLSEWNQCLKEILVY